jgi:amino acid adenylation domain-containing protein
MRQSREGTREMSIINERPSRLAGPSLLHELVASSSDEAAIDFLEHGSRRRKMSYRALHTLSDILAQKIVDTMAKLEDASAIVPVLLPQCPELYVVLLAILKAGKAFCPIGLDTPTERLKFILDDISANLLITDYAHGSKLHLASSIITLHADQILSSTDEHIPYRSLHVRTDDLAYVLYTSGSTGAPKAVSVSHRAVTQSLLAHDRHIPNFGRFLQFAAPTFDVSIFEIFFPWYRGRTLVGRTRSLMLDDLAGTIIILDVDAAELTPTVVSNLLDGRSSVPSLKLLLTIGEMLTREVIAEYGDSDERVGILWAMYGPTEAAIHCTLQPLISATASTGLIGYPLDTVSAFIAAPHSGDDLHSDLTILPIGDEGELVVGGPQIAEEYLNRPDLTSASFMHHSKYGYLYRTGDRAKLCSDGTLECLGRVATGQVKLKGQRVELGEIEQIILKVEGCRAAAVLVVKEQLVAFCAIGNREISRADVRQICKQWLPEIMIPSDVVLMHSMPQLPSGKINKASLSAGYRQAPHSDNSLSADFDNDTAHPILHLLSKHLQRDLGLDSDLAPAGLDSLQAIRLASALRSGGYHLTTLQILSATTARDILVAANAASSAGIATGIHHADDTTFADEIKVPEVERYGKRIAYTLPCTPLQEAMLAETITRPGAYCNWFEVEVFEPHSFEDIRNALQRLARGTEILRTGFCPATNSDGTFVQVVWTELEAAQIRQVREFTRSYSLGSPESLLRPLSVQASTKSGKPRLLFQLHHALYDGWSIDLILEDLGKLLRGEQLPQRPQFRDIVRYHAQRETGSHVSDKRYWTQMLRERPESSLPNFNGTIVTNSTSHSWSGRSTVSLQSLVKRSRGLLVNPQVYFQAAVAYVTSAYVGSSDVVIGNVTSGRTIPVAGVEDIIGPCIASLPFRLHFDSLTKVREILSETQRLNRESLEHCSLPLREIAKAASVRAGVRLFDVLFVWQQSLQSLTNSKTSLQLVDSADELEFNVTLEYEPHPDHISFRATFDPSTIPVNQVKHFARQIDEVVQFFLDYTDGRTSEITRGFTTASRSIANALPRQRILTHGPARAVERWAQATPEKEAVVVFCLEDGAMRMKAKATYATLNRDANRFARILQNNGVCSGDLVAVIMEKSLDLYVSILAVLKLGAGYLPLVPDLPAERTRTILHDARVAICISDSLALPELRQRTTATIVCIGNTDLSVYPGHDFDVAYDGSRVAYAVFTSGSTGTPKGVLVTQDNLMSNLEHLSTVYPYSAHSRLLQSCSQAFDVSVFEIFFSWHVGICLCTAKKDDLFIDLESAIDKMGITHLSLTPTVAALVDPDNVPRVELLVTAGEAVTEHVRRKWAGRGLYQGQSY